MKIRTRVIVTGLVQGVNFRYHTRQTALAHNVSGWVMNLADGSVEACFEGEEASVHALVDWCRSGPDLARVDHLALRHETYRGEFDDFRIIR